MTQEITYTQYLNFTCGGSGKSMMGATLMTEWIRSGKVKVVGEIWGEAAENVNYCRFLWGLKPNEPLECYDTFSRSIKIANFLDQDRSKRRFAGTVPIPFTSKADDVLQRSNPDWFATTGVANVQASIRPY